MEKRLIRQETIEKIFDIKASELHGDMNQNGQKKPGNISKFTTR